MDDDYGLAADRYEAVTGTSKHDYEQRLLRAARRTLLRGPLIDDGCKADSVALVGNGANTKLAVIYRIANRPGRVFGWRVPIWPAPDPHDIEAGSPELLANLLVVHLAEAVNTIPFHHEIQAPDGHGVEWVLDEG